MAKTRSSGLVHQVRTLFGAGVAGGLSDAELLDRFLSRSAAAEDAALAAEAAFAALVARHGPMVLGVCRRALADPNDVEDAFQATFFVLVRRARSVRVGDSLGRWLYGVARRVAAKAQARSERARVRSVPLGREPVASAPPADRIELLAALDEEVSRLPEKYRAPVVLCDLEGLTHAEAAARLRWPVGTVSGRLSRARDLLRNRLVRRGMAPTAGSTVALLATEGARAAVSEPLAAATVQAATRLAMGSGSQAGVASVSASALSLMNAVLRAAVMVKLKVAAAVLLVVAVAGAAVGAGIGVGTGAPGPARDQDAGRAPAVASHAVAHPTAGHRPADEIVKQIEAALAMAAEPGLGYAGAGELRLMRNVNDLNALPSAGKRLFIVADVKHALHLRMFDLEGKMVLDSDAKRFTNTWAEYLQQLVPTLWTPHKLTEIDKISVFNAFRELAGPGRSVPDEMRRVHDRIASLVDELRTAYPDDPRVTHYMPERWASLTMFGKGGVVYPEIREALETTKDPKLRNSALYFETSLRFREPIDGRTAVSLAESFAGQAPGDKRAGELLHMAWHRLGADWSTLVCLAAVFAMFAGLLAATIGMRRWLIYVLRALKFVLRMGVVLLGLFAVALAGFYFLENDTLIAAIRDVNEKIIDGSPMALSRLLAVSGPDLQHVQALAGTIRAAFAVMLAALCAVFLVVARRRFAEPPLRWPSLIRLGILGFFAVLAATCGVDACLIGFQRNAIRERIVRDYPPFRGKLIQGGPRQRERIEGPQLRHG
jgi:RNA polymerase sigma factor (sigma-70 family)